MGKLVGKIVLTGGPSAGKTSALDKIVEDLSKKGYVVLVIRETATELINAEIKPFGDDAIDIIKFQHLVINYQLQKEKIYDKVVSMFDDETKCVIICERGLLDNKAYVSSAEFDKILKSKDLSTLEIMDRYDMVIHMVSAAVGKKESYTLENNKARTESVEKAILLDQKIIDAWNGHHNLKVINNEDDFDLKLQNVVNEVKNLVLNPYTSRNQRKYLVDLTKSNLSFLNGDNSNQMLIEQTYIDNCQGREVRLRKRTFQNVSSHYLTVQIKQKDGKSKVLTNKVIRENEYNRLLFSSNVKTSVVKQRYSFTKNKQCFRLDIFNKMDEYADTLNYPVYAP
jgi:thymidylate kinase